MKFSASVDRYVRHRRVRVGDVDCFYREAGPTDASVVLLPHGYPCSSYEFRNLMPLLADRYRVLAPDFPGAGYTQAPPSFQHDFAGYAEFLEAFIAALRIERFAIYLHDFGSSVGLRVAMRDPQRIRALIIQNGDIYMDTLGPMYRAFLDYFDHRTSEGRRQVEAAVSLQGYQHEFLNTLEGDIASRVPPDLWHLHWALTTPERRQHTFQLLESMQENFTWFSRYQTYLREHRPATLIVWGPNDGYMPEASARAYLRDLPDASLHLLDGGHWLLETHLYEVEQLMRSFLARALG